MSLITLHYGQCGNQISESFFSNIYEIITNGQKPGTEDYKQTVNKWFHITKKHKWEPRSILIDTEMKTVQHPTHIPYQFKNIVAKSCGGSANNWAFGYLEQSKLLRHGIIDCVRKELERCDVFGGFLNIFSSSGGTGSGIGSFITEILKSDFPNKAIMNAVILPYSNGELITQSYNTLLTLSKIYSVSDAIILFENDRLHYNCLHSQSIKDVSFADINNLLVRQLLTVFQPLKDLQTSDLLLKLCEDPLYKFLQLRYVPVSKMEYDHSWKSLLSSVARQSRFDFQQKSVDSLHLRPKNYSVALISRGLHKPEENDLKLLKDPTLYSSKQSLDKAFQVYYHRKKIFNLDNCLTVVANSNNICSPVNVIVQDAWNMYKYGAYLHHFKKYGVDESSFKHSFEVMRDILTSYKKL